MFGKIVLLISKKASLPEANTIEVGLSYTGGFLDELSKKCRFFLKTLLKRDSETSGDPENSLLSLLERYMGKKDASIVNRIWKNI
ncbi:MAG: hypothetical protein MHMPM18_004229 [Marteilia pararefringens]